MAEQPSGTPAPHDPLDQVLADLRRLDDAAPPDQVALYERIHSGLAGALAGTVDQSAAGAGGR